MKERGCEREIDLIGALRRGEMPDELRDHARACPACSEAARIAVWMNHLAAETPRPASLPDPAILRLKAQLFGRTRVEERILRPVRLAQRIGFAVVALCWTAIAMWNWESVSSFSFDRLVASVLEGASISPSSLAVLFGLGCVTILLTVHTALVEE